MPLPNWSFNSIIISYLYFIFLATSMNSMNGESGGVQQMEVSHFEKMQPVDFNLTYQQFLVIQHALPKKYALIEHKNIKKGGVVPSAVKLGPEDVVGITNQNQNMSKLSGNIDNTEEIEGRTKRIRIKKVDKFLEEEPLKGRKPTVNEMSIEDQFAQCSYILTQLKKHKSAFPFLEPVDPKRDGVLNYFQIIKEPMDLSTVQSNLNNGVYRTPAEFHAHINKIWTNSYTYNQKGSLVNKLTVDMEKYYKTLLGSDNFRKALKGDKPKARVEKDKVKVEVGQDRDQRKKADYFTSKDFVYDE